MIIINPKSSNPMKYRTIEPPIWCALMAKDGDTIVDLEIQGWMPIGKDILIVAMGSNPSASSTPKMPEVNRLKKFYPWAKVTGLHPMATGEADVNIPTPEELVKIPRAKWELLDMTKYKAHNWHCLHDIDHRDKYAVLYTSYGCPFDCDFCNIHTIYGGRKVYYRNPQDVISEIDFLVKNYHVRNLKLCDELFTLNPTHVSAICDGIKDYHLNIWAYARVGTVTPTMLLKMKQAGINWLGYGFESSSPRVLQGVNKNYQGILETVQMTKDAGINIIGNFIFGLPNDTLKTMAETLEFAWKLRCEYVNFYCALPYPGSKLYNDSKDWGSFDQYSPNIGVPKLVKDFRDKAFQEYFSNPQYLAMIQSKFGTKAKNHIKDMLMV